MDAACRILIYILSFFNFANLFGSRIDGTQIRLSSLNLPKRERLRRASRLRRKKREEFLGRLVQTRKGRRLIQSCERKRYKDRRRR
jgi:hypothetical protein